VKDVGGRRIEIQILADILRLSEGGKTEIALFANLGHRQLEKYLTLLVDYGFMEKSDGLRPPVYQVTRKGRHLLDSIDRVSATLGLETSSMGENEG